MLPPFAALIVLFVVPVALMAVYSFWSVDNDYQLVREFGLQQYRKILADPLYLATLMNSALMALATTVVCVALAVPLAWALARSVPQQWRILLIVGLILPGWVSVLIRTYATNLVIGQSGFLNWTLMSAGLIGAPFNVLFTKTAVVIGLVYIYLPYTLIPIYAAIERLDPAILEAAENLGATPFRRFYRIVLPMILPGIVAGSIITFVPALGEYLVPNLLGGLQGVMYGNLIVTAFQSFNWPLGSALSVILLAAMLLILLAFSRMANLSRSLLAER
jgi:ABC-type spermidine/putrescine transport system permease subunit I